MKELREMRTRFIVSLFWSLRDSLCLDMILYIISLIPDGGFYNARDLKLLFERETKISDASFSGAKLPKMYFMDTYFEKCNFSDCNLREACFADCQLVDCNFYNSDLRNSRFINVFSSSDFDCRFGGTVFRSSDLRQSNFFSISDFETCSRPDTIISQKLVRWIETTPEGKMIVHEKPRWD